MIRIVIAIVLAACTLSIAMAQPAKASWWEQHANEQATKLENACNTLIDNGTNVGDCKRRADLLRLPENASTREWAHHQNAIVAFAHYYRAQFDIVYPPLGQAAKK